MSDLRGTDRPPPRGLRLGAAMALVLLAFVIGVALAVYVMRVDRLKEATAGTARPASVATATAPAAIVAVRTPAAAAVDPVTLATRETTLAAQLTALEARAAAVDLESAAAGTQAGRAEAVLTAAAVRRAIDRGQPLGYLETPLRLRFGQAQPRAVAIILHAAHQPVTLETLRTELDTVAADLLVGGGEDWVDRWRREIGRLVVLRRADMPADTPAERLQRVRLLLDTGQVEAARSAVAQLPGAAEAADWNNAAGRYILTRQALDRIENTALTVPPPAPVAAGPSDQGASPVTG